MRFIFLVSLIFGPALASAECVCAGYCLNIKEHNGCYQGEYLGSTYLSFEGASIGSAWKQIEKSCDPNRLQLASTFTYQKYESVTCVQGVALATPATICRCQE